MLSCQVLFYDSKSNPFRLSILTDCSFENFFRKPLMGGSPEGFYPKILKINSYKRHLIVIPVLPIAASQSSYTIIRDSIGYHQHRRVAPT